jgi:hypothetical protein
MAAHSFLPTVHNWVSNLYIYDLWLVLTAQYSTSRAQTRERFTLHHRSYIYLAHKAYSVIYPIQIEPTEPRRPQVTQGWPHEATQAQISTAPYEVSHRSVETTDCDRSTVRSICIDHVYKTHVIYEFVFTSLNFSIVTKVIGILKLPDISENDLRLWWGS